MRGRNCVVNIFFCPARRSRDFPRDFARGRIWRTASCLIHELRSRLITQPGRRRFYCTFCARFRRGRDPATFVTKRRFAPADRRRAIIPSFGVTESRFRDHDRANVLARIVAAVLSADKHVVTRIPYR